MTENEFQKLHDLCRNNRNQFAENEIVGCFFCLRIFDHNEINKWADSNDSSARCPYCGIDAVIPVTDIEILKAMQTHWFSADRGTKS
jgi:hypothetical protein